MLSLGCDGACPATAQVTERLAAAHPAVEIAGVTPLDDYYSRELARPRAAAAIAFAFAWTALVSAAAGLFSLLLHTVTSRRRELGIRIALGASATDIRRLMIREGLTVVLAGISLGVISGLALARMLTTLLFDVSMADPANWVVAAGVLSIAVAAAAWHPMQAAARTAPAVLLREE
jgi:ABC-type antimicrobial peptide transport system permease subunit